MDHDKPFDRQLRRLRRDRAARRISAADYLHRLAADELLNRLETVKRTFRSALNLGCAHGYLAGQLRARGIDVTCADAGWRFADDHGGIQCDEDRLPFADGAFDLVVSVGAFDTINDLPGALTLIRRALRPDGLLLAAFAGAGSLPRLRSAMRAAEHGEEGASPRIHPQIDVRAAGDLLTRTGFALQVTDAEAIDVRFPGIMDLVGDLRAMAGTNILAGRARKPLLRSALAAASSDFASHADPDGKTAERFEIVYMTAWSPAPDQPRAAARGSGTASLTSVLRPPR